MNTCQIIQDGQMCGKSAVIRLISIDLNDKSICVCADHWIEAQKPERKNEKEINHGYQS